MMKTLITSLFLIFSISLAYADFQLKYKDGKTLAWDQYTEEGDYYCTWKSIGQICIPKKDIASVKEINEDIPEGARVIEPKTLSAEERERDRQGFSAERLIAEQEEKEAKRRERCAEILNPNPFTRSSSKGFASALIGISSVIGQRNAYNDCLAGVKRQPIKVKPTNIPIIDYEQLRYRYEGNSGKKYQYDLSNQFDRIQYKTDPAAKLRDRFDIDIRRDMDRGLGQYGGGGK